MIYGFINELVPLPQLSKLCPDNIYNGVNITTKITLSLEAFHRSNAAYLRDATLEFLINDMHKGDILLTSTLLNLSFAGAYNYVAPIHIVRKFLEKGLHVISILEKFDSDDYDNETFIYMDSLMKRLQLEIRPFMSRKQKEGIAKAKATGRYPDRSFKPSDFPEFDSLYQLYQDDYISKSEMAKRLSISRPTLDKLFLMRQHALELERNEESSAKRSEGDDLL